MFFLILDRDSHIYTKLQMTDNLTTLLHVVTTNIYIKIK